MHLASSNDEHSAVSAVRSCKNFSKVSFVLIIYRKLGSQPIFENLMF